MTLARRILPGTIVATIAAACISAGAQAAPVVLFEDGFNSGIVSPAWKSIGNSQWVQDGWMHVRDNDGGARDAGALVNDGNHGWTDYRVSMMADFVESGPMAYDNLAILLRTDGYWRQSGISRGSAYEFEITGPRGTGPPDNANTVGFSRWVNGQDVGVGRVQRELPSQPFLVEAQVVGDHIQLWIDHVKVFDLHDPQPLLYGGVGVHTIWETESRFDDVWVVAVPEPRLCVMLGFGLLLAAGRISRDRAHRHEMHPDGAGVRSVRPATIHSSLGLP